MSTSVRRATTLVVVLLALLAVAGPVLLLTRSRQSTAAFGDSETVGANHLGAATIDIEVGERSATLSAPNMAPGDTVVGWLDLHNAGDLALRYSIVTDNDADVLLDQLRWDLWTTPTSCAVAPAIAGRLVEQIRLPAGSRVPLLGSPEVGSDPGDRTLEPGDGERLCIAATLPSDAPNTVQGHSISQRMHVVSEQAPDAAP